MGRGNGGNGGVGDGGLDDILREWHTKGLSISLKHCNSRDGLFGYIGAWSTSHSNLYPISYHIRSARSRAHATRQPEARNGKYSPLHLPYSFYVCVPLTIKDD